jgi:hypothetical protein
MATKEEDCGRSGNSVKDFGIAGSDKFHALHQHEFILITRNLELKQIAVETWRCDAISGMEQSATESWQEQK